MPYLCWTSEARAAGRRDESCCCAWRTKASTSSVTCSGWGCKEPSCWRARDLGSRFGLLVMRSTVSARQLACKYNYDHTEPFVNPAVRIKYQEHLDNY